MEKNRLGYLFPKRLSVKKYIKISKRYYTQGKTNETIERNNTKNTFTGRSRLPRLALQYQLWGRRDVGRPRRRWRDQEHLEL
jgi:phage terminase large subunit